MPPADDRTASQAVHPASPQAHPALPGIPPAPPEELRAGRVVLRRLRAADAAAVASAVRASLDHLRPWMPWATSESAQTATQRTRIAEASALWEAGSDYLYSVLLAGDLTLAGEIGLHRRVGDGGIEIGYWIAAGQAGRGLGSSAAAALTEAALRLGGVSRVEIHCDEANLASAAIPRKLGYRLDRVEAHEPEAPGERGRRMIWVITPGQGRDRDRDWVGWHADYDVPGSPLAQRLAAVQDRIREALDEAPAGELRAISMCAGQGRDLIGVLGEHPRGQDVTARLVELDPRNAASARELAAAAGLPRVQVVTGDAGMAGAYAGLVPAGLVLACGVFGNISDRDIEATVSCCAQLCATGGTVIWTRGRWEPDLVPQICDWFAGQGFELSWLSGPGLGWGVGAHRFRGQPQPLDPGLAMFSFSSGPRPNEAARPGC